MLNVIEISEFCVFTFTTACVVIKENQQIGAFLFVLRTKNTEKKNQFKKVYFR